MSQSQFTAIQTNSTARGFCLTSAFWMVIATLAGLTAATRERGGIEHLKLELEGWQRDLSTTEPSEAA